MLLRGGGLHLTELNWFAILFEGRIPRQQSINHHF
jgi:hypothetical protein